YTWVYFLKKKSQVPETIMLFIKRVKNQNDIKVKQLRTENGTEFRNSILSNFYDERGMFQNFSSPYTPKQNGVVERKNRTLIEAARTMLSGSVFSKQYWTEAVATACYTQNRVFNTRRQQSEETYHITSDESTDAIKFTKPSDDNITIAEFKRYTPDEYLHPYEPSQRYQANHKKSHLIAINRIFRKSTLGACQLLGGKLVCWSAKKQKSIAMSSAEAEYVAAAGCCATILWMKSQLSDYDILYEMHIDIRYHFIRDHILKGDIELHFIPTPYQLADIFIKPLDEPNFKRLICELGILNIDGLKLEPSNDSSDED
ncbi:retrovirus-related pol polyprotein from transposon TNT 1-94, partial [Tanacetum coccineum]